MPSILLSDNGVSSGSAGLKSTAASDGSLALQTTTAGGTATTAVTIDTSQNMGLGVTPSALWSTNYRVFSLSQGSPNNFVSSIGQSNVGTLFFATNYYAPPGSSNYINDGYALQYAMRKDVGEHRWYNAPSGTAGNAISFTQAMTLDASGNLGVGTTSIQNYTNSKTLAVGGAAAGVLDFVASNIGSGNNRAAQIFGDSSGNMVLSTGASNTLAERARINSSGTLLVGLTDSSNYAKLCTTSLGVYEGNDASDGGVNISKQSGSPTRLGKIASYGASSGLTFWTNASGTDYERVRIDYLGNLLVGTTDNSTSSGVGFKINANASAPNVGQVVNTAGNTNTYHFYNTNATNNGYRFYVNINGGVYNYSGNNSNLSDERTKTNIEVAGSYLEKICAIPVKLFNYKDEAEGEQRTLGVIAQDVEAVAPELVDQNGWLDESPEGEAPLKSVYTTDMMYALMKAIQEQQAIITQLQADVAALKGA